MLPLSRQERLRERYRAARPGFQYALDRYRVLLDTHATPDARLLDVGCGPAGLVSPYEGRARLVAGVDRYLTAFSEEPPQIRAVAEADGDALPFADHSFSLVASSWVLEHLPEPRRVYAEVYRVLAPGGRFVFITPNADSYPVLLRRLVPSRVSQRVVRAVYGRNEDFINPTFYRANTQRDLLRDLHAAGFADAVFEQFSDPTYLAFNEPLYRLSVLLEALIVRVAPALRVHIVGMVRKPETA